MKGKVLLREELKSNEINQMFEVMKNHYENINYEKFIRDLSKKRWVILLEENGRVAGFSTAALIEIETEGKKIKGVFSGDTIIDQQYKWEMEFQKRWVKFVTGLMEEHKEGLYWFLLSKGEKTYRFLPLYFKKFYPNCETDTPAEIKEIMDWYAMYIYGENYDSNRGVVINRGENDYLNSKMAEVNGEKMKNKHIRFFLEANSGYLKGDELVCIAELSFDNFKDSVKRMLRDNDE